MFRVLEGAELEQDVLGKHSVFVNSDPSLTSHGRVKRR
jgi:hypothetical protein